jgi:hypothetical protein
VKVEQGEPSDLLAMMAAEEIDQPVSGRDIGPDGMRGTATAMGKMTRPARR